MIYDPNMIDPVVFENWPVNAPIRHIMPRDDYKAIIAPTAQNLGFWHRYAALEYFLGVWAFYGVSNDPEYQPNDGLIQICKTLASSHAPHVILKMYRIQKGLE